MVPGPLGVVFMGVSGSGKSSLGAATAAALKAPFLEGDDFHPETNRLKLRGGIPLTDADRWPWLDALALALGEQAARHPRIVCACSALKRAYREHLRSRSGVPLLFVCLLVEAEILRARLASRAGHFVAPSLLDSQLATLELPSPCEHALILHETGTPAALVQRVVDHLWARTALSASAGRC